MCFRIEGLHRHGSKDEYFSIQIVHLFAEKILPQSGGASFQPQEFFMKIGHCPLTAASVQCSKRGKHRTGREHEKSHRVWYHDGRQTDLQYFTQKTVSYAKKFII